jgi:trk system potassium uptake protein TrkA
VSILIVGGGDIGSILAERLSSERKDVVVVEAGEQRARELRERVDVQVVHGSGSSPAVLRTAGLDDAEMLVAVTDSDEVNLVSCLVASKEGIIPTKIARVRDPDLAEAIMRIFGEDTLALNINPEEEAAQAVIKILRVPGAAGVLEFADGKAQVVTFSLDCPCEAEGMVLADLKNRPEIEVNIVAISRGGKFLTPDGRTTLERGDLVYAAGRPEKLGAFSALLGKGGPEARRIVVSGGGNVAYYLARALESEDISIKVIEPDTERCKFLVERLNRSVVLQGHGTDPALLAEENVGNADAFLALTRDEEDNILAALLAKRAGASKVIALVNKLSYVSLASAIGVDAVVSPNLAAVSAILHFIRKGKVLSVTTVGEEAAEALEVVALETSDLVGRPLREIDFKDAIVGAIVRGEKVVIPGGDDVIEVGDHVIIFALRSAIEKLERKMMVKVQYF